MKKLAVVLGILLLGQVCIAQDEITNAVEEAMNGQNFNENKVAISIQKHPAADTAINQTSKGNWFCIIIQYVGAVPKVKATE